MIRRVVIVQARLSSSRLPGKVLMPLLGRPSIQFMIERVRQSRCTDEIVVATSDDRSDDTLADQLGAAGIRCYRGSLNDVLARYHGAAIASGATHVVRLTGDCPLMDADLVDSALELLDLSGADYVSNVDPPTYPDGLDVEAFTFAALDRAFSEASEVRDREHVTPFLRERKDLFRSTGFRGLADFSALRWTVDHSDDLDHVRRLLACVGAKAPTDFDRFDLYRICERERSRLAQPAHVRNEAMQPALGPGDSS